MALFAIVIIIIRPANLQFCQSCFLSISPQITKKVECAWILSKIHNFCFQFLTEQYKCPPKLQQNIYQTKFYA